MNKSRRRSTAAIAVSLAALAVVVVALWPRSSTPPTDAERTAHIASRLRCPFCSGESIADATSQVARDLEVVIGEQVAAGMSDEEIYAYFSERYGESLLLDPPFLGWGWALWALPLLVLVGGGAIVWRRRRGRLRPDPAPASGPLDEARLREQLGYVTRDRADVAAQQASGELDGGTALALTTALDEEARALSSAIAAGGPPAEEAVDEPSRRVWNRRVLAGAAFLVAGVAAVVVTLALTSDDSASGGIVDAPPIDLASITTDRLEEVIAANPDVIPMRILLGQMLMEEGEVARAAVQFGEVLQREDNPEAMAWLGYISFLAEQDETAEQFLENALEIQPNYPQALWWLANVRMLGLQDPAGAIEPLQSLLASSGVPDDVRQSAEEMLTEAQAQS